MTLSYTTFGFKIRVFEIRQGLFNVVDLFIFLAVPIPGTSVNFWRLFKKVFKEIFLVISKKSYYYVMLMMPRHSAFWHLAEVTLCIMTLSISGECHYAQCLCTECRGSNKMAIVFFQTLHQKSLNWIILTSKQVWQKNFFLFIFQTFHSFLYKCCYFQ